MPGPLHLPNVTRRPIGWDQAGQGYRAPTLRQAADFEWELRTHDDDAEKAIVAALSSAPTVLDGGVVALPAEIQTIVFNVGAPVHNLSQYRSVVCRVHNVGANPITSVNGVGITAAATFTCLVWASAVAVVANAAGVYMPGVSQYIVNAYGPPTKSPTPECLRVDVISALGSSARCYVYAWKW